LKADGTLDALGTRRALGTDGPDRAELTLETLRSGRAQFSVAHHVDLGGGDQLHAARLAPRITDIDDRREHAGALGTLRTLGTGGADRTELSLGAWGTLDAHLTLRPLGAGRAGGALGTLGTRRAGDGRTTPTLDADVIGRDLTITASGSDADEVLIFAQQGADLVFGEGVVGPSRPQRVRHRGEAESRLHLLIVADLDPEPTFAVGDEVLGGDLHVDVELARHHHHLLFVFGQRRSAVTDAIVDGQGHRHGAVEEFARGPGQQATEAHLSRSLGRCGGADEAQGRGQAHPKCVLEIHRYLPSGNDTVS
jgi:hypothetical protein